MLIAARSQGPLTRHGQLHPPPDAHGLRSTIDFDEESLARSPAKGCLQARWKCPRAIKHPLIAPSISALMQRRLI